MNIVLLAPPAAGKGTMSELLEKNYGFIHISTGDLLREALHQENEQAKYLKEIMESGKLVDDSIIMNLVKEKLATSQGHNCIFDGFPRNKNQALALDELLASMSRKIACAIYITVPKEIALKRTVGRRTCPQCKKVYNIYFEVSKPKVENLCDTCQQMLETRTDDTELVFEKRYDTYLKETAPLIDYYQQKGILKEVENQNKEEAFNNIVQILGEL